MVEENNINVVINLIVAYGGITDEVHIPHIKTDNLKLPK